MVCGRENEDSTLYHNSNKVCLLAEERDRTSQQHHRVLLGGSKIAAELNNLLGCLGITAVFGTVLHRIGRGCRLMCHEECYRFIWKITPPIDRFFMRDTYLHGKGKVL